MTVVKLGEVPQGDKTGAAEVKRRANQQMKEKEPITLTRDCDAVLIPSGEKYTLPAGATVRVTQSLGGAFTVTTSLGFMARIAGTDADALGLDAGAAPAAQDAATGRSTEELVLEQLKTCFDPEIPVNIVDLGLVYDCQVKNDGRRVEVKFTLTAPGCGMGDILKRDIESKLLAIPGVEEAAVEVVLDPPWDASRMSEAARLQLGML